MTNNRLIKNDNGQIFVPMNIEGGAWRENFMTSSKIITLAAILMSNIMIIMWMGNSYMGIMIKLIVLALMLYVDQLLLRYIVFEEKYYYKMYKKMEKYNISNLSVFWNILEIKDTEDGAICIYGDGKVGVLIRLERDTIVGKREGFEEAHYDALSDFYKELNIKNLRFIQLGLMEQAGKDPRLQKLDELVTKTDNENVAKIVESQVGYIKKITRATLFESDYFLIYSDDINMSDSILMNSIECACILLNGAFIGFEVVDKNSIIELMKEQPYGVRYFDYIDAVVGIYRNSGINIPKAFNIVGVSYDSGEYDEIGNEENNRINLLSSYINRGIVKSGEWTIKEALKGNIKKKEEKEYKQEEVNRHSKSGKKYRPREVEHSDSGMDNDIFNIVDENIQSLDGADGEQSDKRGGKHKDKIGVSTFGLKFGKKKVENKGKNKGIQYGKNEGSSGDKIQQNLDSMSFNDEGVDGLDEIIDL